MSWNWLCRFGIHRWTPWKHQRSTTIVDDFNAPIRIDQFFYRACDKCQRPQQLRIKGN